MYETTSVNTRLTIQKINGVPISLFRDLKAWNASSKLLEKIKIEYMTNLIKNSNH